MTRRQSNFLSAAYAVCLPVCLIGAAMGCGWSLGCAAALVAGAIVARVRSPGAAGRDALVAAP